MDLEVRPCQYTIIFVCETMTAPIQIQKKRGHPLHGRERLFAASTERPPKRSQGRTPLHLAQWWGPGHPPPSDRLKLPEGPDQAASNVEIAAGTVTDVSGTLSDMSSERPISLRNDPSDVSPEEQRPTDRPTDTRRTGLLTLG